jgi:predicted ATPase
VQRIDDAVKLSEEPGHLYSLSAARAHGAHLHQLRRDLDRTSEWAEKTLRVSGAQGYLYYMAFAQILQGWAVAKQVDSARGLGEMREGLARLGAVGAQLDRPYLLALLAEAEIDAGHVVEASATLDEAFALVRHSRTFFYEVELLRLKASLAQRARKPPSEAEALLRSAMTLAASQGAKSLELRTGIDLYNLLVDAGSPRDARRLLEPLYRSFDEGGNTADLQTARSLLTNATPRAGARDRRSHRG